MEKQVYTTEQNKTILSFLQKLVGLGIVAYIKSVTAGPVITGYHFKLSNNVPISRILNKSEDFALAASAEKVLIERIGGEVVISVANKERKLIEFKDYMYWYCTDKSLDSMKIPIPVGVDTLGTRTAIDLTQQPHILLAGSTGSGKSVLEAAILCSLAVRLSPQDLRMYLVDTKQLDLPLFNNLPHVQRVVKTLSEFHDLMGYLLTQHTSRSAIISGAACRNINEYNNLMGQDSLRRLPHILLMIDEFGDLIMQDREVDRSKKGKESGNSLSQCPKVEEWLQRLVQVSRATGIHVIAGTQRTSVKIINGDIKANFPCRISLRLPTEADSRTILGQGGAENLLGKGDMLIQFPDNEVVKRYHGPFVNLTDIAHIIDQNEFIRHQFASVRGEVLR